MILPFHPIHYLAQTLFHTATGHCPFSLLITTKKKHSPEILNESVLRRQIEELQQELQPLDDLSGAHAEDPAEVHHRLAYRELAVQGDLLGHVANALSGHARAFGTGFATQHPYLAGVQSTPADDAREQRRFAAAAGTEEPVSVERSRKWLFAVLVEEKCEENSFITINNW